MLLPQTRRVGLVVLCLCWVTFVANAQNNEVVSISGTLLMLDEKTLHVTVVVQAVTPAPDGKGEPMLISPSSTSTSMESCGLEHG